MALQQGHAQQREAIARAWGRTCLRRGERLRLGLRACRRTCKRVKQSHPNAWTLTGTLSLAFRSIGQTAPDARGLRQTRREVDAVAAVALAHKHCVDVRLRRLSQQLQGGSASPWLLVERCFDTTPVMVGFGMFKPMLAPVARFWWRDQATRLVPGASPWIVLGMDEYMRRSGGHEPSRGTLDMLAQSCRLTWAESQEDGASVLP